MFTKEFKEIGKGDVAIAGGKGASLGEMTQAGIPVPNGYVILSKAFEYFIEKNGLNGKIDAILNNMDYKQTDALDSASEKIKELIIKAETPEEIRNEITMQFKKLDAKFVAVRSSATSEDSSTAAWAGQLDTYLNTTEESILANVKRCWASLFTSRAIFYRFEKKLDKTKISVAVVVQKMVQSEISGIAFSVHPVTQDRSQMIIEAGFGLGEAIVSGQITPDSYIVDKRDFSITEINVAEQEKKIVRKGAEGNAWVDIDENLRNAQKLSESQIAELARLIVKISDHYGFPVDVEWAMEGGRFFITQSRPITTLRAQ